MADDRDPEPANALESLLLKAQLGQSSVDDVLDALAGAEVYVLVDRDPGPTGLWDNTAAPLELANKAGLPVFPVFTSAGRFAGWHRAFPRFTHWTLVPFQVLLRGIADGVGVVVNPGRVADLELAPDAVARLKAKRPPAAGPA